MFRFARNEQPLYSAESTGHAPCPNGFSFHALFQHPFFSRRLNCQNTGRTRHSATTTLPIYQLVFLRSTGRPLRRQSVSKIEKPVHTEGPVSNDITGDKDTAMQSKDLG